MLKLDNFHNQYPFCQTRFTGYQSSVLELSKLQTASVIFHALPGMFTYL